MRLNINLATNPYEDAGKFWIRWGGGAAVVGLFTLILLYTAIMGWLTARKDRGLIRQAETQIADRDREKAAAEALLNLDKNSTTRDRSQFLNDLFQRKAFSWTQVFEDMERVMPPRLHVVSIHPEINSDNQVEIRVSVAGDSRDRALELVRKMESSEHFQQTRIDEESQQTGMPGGDTVKFEISAIYVPGIESKSSQGGAP